MIKMIDTLINQIFYVDKNLLKKINDVQADCTSKILNFNGLIKYINEEDSIYVRKIAVPGGDNLKVYDEKEEKT